MPDDLVIHDPIQGTPPALPADPSIADLKAYFAPEPVAPAAPSAPASAAPAKPAAPATPAAETAPASEPEKKQERDETGKFVAKEPAAAETAAEPVAKKDELPPGVQKRIDREIGRTVAARREAEDLARQLKERLAKPQGTDPAQETVKPAPVAAAKPKLDDYPSYDEYMDARDAWNREQWNAEQEKRTTEQKSKDQVQQQETAAATTWSQRAAEALTKDPEFQDAIDTIGGPLTQAGLHTLVMESEHGPAVVKYLYDHQDEGAKILALGNPMLMAREIGKIEAKVSSAAAPAAPAPSPQTEKPAPGAAPAPPAAPLPKPISPVPSSGKADVDLSTCDFGTFKREIQKLVSTA